MQKAQIAGLIEDNVIKNTFLKPIDRMNKFDVHL